jgi:uncharacterized protein
MSRPPDVRNDSFVDAVALAAVGGRVERSYSASDLPRLAEAGGLEGTSVQASFQFSEFDGRPVVDGRLAGRFVLTCQRCMGPVSLAIDEQFQVLIVAAERADEPGGYEPVIADASRLDLRWLAEDQALLALPLVAMHAPEECEEQADISEESEKTDTTAQKPFQNLRDMMRKR